MNSRPAKDARPAVKPKRNSHEFLERVVQIGKRHCDFVADRFQLREQPVNFRDTLFSHPLGKALMLHAFAKTLEVAEHVGVYALTLEAINEQKAVTYKQWGFTPFIERELLMFIPIATIREALTGAL